MYKGKTVKLTFKNALHVSEFRHNLISIDRLCRRGCRTLFDLDRAVCP